MVGCFSRLARTPKRRISTNSIKPANGDQSFAPIPNRLVKIKLEKNIPRRDQNKKMQDLLKYFKGIKISFFHIFPKKQTTGENSRTRRELEDHRQFTCEICFESINLDHSQISQQKSLHAPALCGLHPVSSMSLISKTLFSKWCDRLCEDSVLGLDKSYCPNKECMTMVVNECGRSVKKSKCPNCKELFCFDCKNKWHAGKCKESEVIMMRDRNDVLLGKLIKKYKWQRCPACGHCVQRSAGCNFVRCRCKTEFCYKCGKKTNSWHEQHRCIDHHLALSGLIMKHLKNSDGAQKNNGNQHKVKTLINGNAASNDCDKSG
ncbi:hypothetical protein ACFE04_007368 [Oxalis oulophora]